MLELVVEVDCETLAGNDPFRMSSPVLHDKAFQYSSLIGEYATGIILTEEPELSISIIAGSNSGSQIIDSEHLKAISQSDGMSKRLTLEFDEKKELLVSRIKGLFDIFTQLAEAQYKPGEIPEDARLQDVFVSHHPTNLFLFETPNSIQYVRFTRDTGETRTYKLTPQTTSKDWLVILGELSYFGRGKKAVFARLDERFGKGNWAQHWYMDGEVIAKDKVIQLYEDAYFHFLQDNPDVLDWLVRTANDVYDIAPSNVNSELDYEVQECKATHLQDIAIRRVLQRLGKQFQGDHLVQIRGHESEGYILNPGKVPFHKPELILPRNMKRAWWDALSVEAFYQHNKALLVSEDAFKVSHVIEGNDEIYFRNGKSYYQADPFGEKILRKKHKGEMHKKKVFTDPQHYQMRSMIEPTPYKDFTRA